MDGDDSRDGDRGHSRDLSVEVRRHESLVHWVVHRQWLGGLPYAEAVQAGRIGLWRALARYEPSRGCTVSTYAVPAIERAVWRAVARARRDGVGPPVVDEDGLDLDETVDAERAVALVAELVATLPDTLRRVVVARWGLGGAEPSTFRDIGRGLGVTKQRAHQLHTEALIHLADPATSLPLRQLLECNTVADYRTFLARRDAWQRARRGTR